jgi:hypothetical protein
MGARPTPISVLEQYFERPITPKTLAHWDEVSVNTWIDFAKTYLAQMQAGFDPAKLAEASRQGRVRLYFEPAMSHEYDNEIVSRQKATPILGRSPYPPEDYDVSVRGLSEALGPLKKHLLVANEIYIRDNFYYCFDAVADPVKRSSWRSDPNVESLVLHSVTAIKRWLPILAGLREPITSGALNFMPYYITPSFPYRDISSPKLHKHLGGLEIPPEDGVVPAAAAKFSFVNYDFSKPPEIPEGGYKKRLDYTAGITAWVNARLLGLDPVFPNREMWKWASHIRFRDNALVDVTTDLMSIEILPLGGEKGLSVADIMKMRRNEDVFRTDSNSNYLGRL